MRCVKQLKETYLELYAGGSIKIVKNVIKTRAFFGSHYINFARVSTGRRFHRFLKLSC